ncbi:hypothetical protein EV284_0417 [Streptomyces sp. BK022]|uniref:hypothetical protein n=1 Tax=Streptomyces sp. BK022 TaxID=2512123 RepID=UPI001029E8BB|nr:hypothetical protein [Streptomyces sp. BK022]RZU45768.1 hypothetical protein EV284_0417 [Streptomyces sp. BK022]
MSLIDHSVVFIGSTGDGWTFVVLNRPIRNAARILTGAGFTAREHQGRTLYLLPPESAEDAHERAGIAAYGLLAHTMDFVDLAWTTRLHGASPAAQPDVTISFIDGTVTATAATNGARAVLARHRFTPSAGGSLYVLPADLSERAVVSAVVQTEAHLHADGIGVRIDLGFATLQDIPPAPSCPGAAPSPPSSTPVKRRSR